MDAHGKMTSATAENRLVEVMFFACLLDHLSKGLLRLAVSVVAVAVFTGMGAAPAAEPEFVGVLALALDDPVAESKEPSSVDFKVKLVPGLPN